MFLIMQGSMNDGLKGSQEKEQGAVLGAVNILAWPVCSLIVALVTDS